MNISSVPRFGILGGLGPEASAYLYYQFTRRLLDKNITTVNSQFPTIFIKNISVDFDDINDGTELGIQESSRAIQELALHDLDFIVMSCNTIHLFRDEIIERSGYKNIINLREVIRQKLPSDRKICVLGSKATIGSGLYDFTDRDYISLQEEDIGIIWDAIVNYSIRKDIDQHRNNLIQLMGEKKDSGAGCFLYCCTEISEIMQGQKVNGSDSFDTLEVLIDYLVEICSNKISTGEYKRLIV